jgi:hypothetical protein
VKCDNTNQTFEKCDQEACNYRKSRLLISDLLDRGFIYEGIIFPPESILPSNSMLMPFDYLDLMVNLYERLDRCDAFVRFNMEGADNYWTLLEQTMWRWLSNESPKEYRIASTGNGYSCSGPFDLDAMDYDEKHLLSRIKRFLRPDARPHGPFMNFGRYARQSFLLNCPSCGNYFVISRKAAEQCAKKKVELTCPFCCKATFRFTFLKEVLFKQQWIWRCDITYAGQKGYLAITPSKMIELLLDDAPDCPESIPVLICIANENLNTESTNTLLAMTGVALFMRGAESAKSIFGGEESGLEFRYRHEGKVKVIR